MARALLISNPLAARNTPERTMAVVRVLRAAGWAIDFAEVRGAGDARAYAVAGVANGVDAVVVFGGDGTTNLAATALVGTDVALGLVPGGTGNLLAGNLRIPGSPVAAAQTIARGRVRRIDLGRLERPDGVRYFAVACGAGADARVMGETGSSQKRRFGVGGYLATLARVLPQIRSADCEITVDGRPLRARAALVLALNCGEMIPPILRIREGAVPDDGVLDVMVLTADSAWGCLRGAGRALQNVALGTGETRYLRYARGQEITIDADPPQPVQFDGDVSGTTPVAMALVRSAIAVLVDGR